MSNNKKPIVSIITIVYNGFDEIEKTILSIINQNFVNFEYIVIDGGSSDGTQSIIEKYIDSIDFYISENDEGIYHAMNKGILKATGDWLNFMNAGDTFFNDNVLTNVFNKKLTFSKLSLIYGYNYNEGNINKPYSLEVLKKGIIMGNHQSMFFNKTLLGSELVYDLKYPIYADYELVNRMFLKYKKESFKYINEAIAVYQGGGISSVVSIQKRIDKFKIVYKYYGSLGVFRSLIFSKFNLNKNL